jgi:hypothetical protein
MLTSGSLEELVVAKTVDYDKKLNFGLSISCNPDPANQKSFMQF